MASRLDTRGTYGERRAKSKPSGVLHPMEARYVEGTSLGHRRDPPRQLAQVDGHGAQLVRRTLQLAQRGRLLASRGGHRLRALTIALRDLGNARDALAQPAELELLLAGRAGDAL